MFVPVRLAFRRLRLELLILVGASLILSAITVVIAAGIADATHLQASCTTHSECPSAGQALGMWVSWVPYARAALVCLSVLAGVILGTSLVAAEFEHGTAVFAWSVAVSRPRWLAETVVAAVLAILVVSIPLAIASVILSQALGPQLDATSSPSGIDPYPLLLIVRAVVAFSLAALVGVVVGRSLPTLLGALLISCLVLGALELTFAGWREADATPIDLAAPIGFYISDAAVAHDGQVVSLSDAFATAERLGKPFEELYRPVQLGLTPETRAWVVAGEGGSIVAIAAAGLIVAGVLVERRRPL